MFNNQNFRFNIKIFLPIIFISMLFLVSCTKKNTIRTSKEQMDNIECITIFVHGTHTQPLTTIFKKFIYGPNALTKIMSLDHHCYIHCAMKKICEHNPKKFPIDSFYSFGWSGKLSSIARKKEANKLYFEILKLVEEVKSKKLIPKITLITHSHGGNVVLNLAKISEENHCNYYIENLVLLACPVQEETKHFIKSKFFNKIFNIYSSGDLLQILDPQGIKTRNQGKNYPIFSQRTFPNMENLKQTKIKINNQSLWHIDFILPKFLQYLSKILDKMPALDSNKKNVLNIQKNGTILVKEI